MLAALLAALISTMSAGLGQEAAVPAEATGNPANTETNLPAFRLKGYQEPLAPHWNVQHELLVYSNTQISFSVPRDYRAQSDPLTQTVNMDYQGNQLEYGACHISLRLLPVPDTTNTLDGDWVRGQILAEHPGAKVMDEFGASLGGSMGYGVELRYSQVGISTVSRIILVPLPETLAEVKLTCTADYIDQHRPTLNQLMLSTRFAPLGTKIEYQVIRLE